MPYAPQGVKGSDDDDDDEFMIIGMRLSSVCRHGEIQGVVEK
jgi:hypothetical protein